MKLNKRLTAILILVLMQAACKIPLLGVSQPQIVETPTVLPPSASPTSTPLPPEPSATLPPLPSLSPTLSPSATQTAVPLPTLTQTATPSGLFGAVNLSAQVISPSCEPKSVRFEVSPAREDVLGVVLFYRLRYKISGERTLWNLGVPMSISNGKFVYDLQSSSLRDFNQFNEPVAWVQFQLAAIDIGGRVLGRSEVYTDKLTISAICP
jgi:hypothetical protein